MSGAICMAEAREIERAVLREISEVAIDARREALLELYGEALEKTQEAVELVQAAIDRLVEVDAAMLKYLSGENEG